jgi:acetyl esterase/lipase
MLLFVQPATAREPAAVSTTMSEQAQTFLANVRSGRLPEGFGSDMADPEALGKMRTALGNMFERGSREIDPDYVLTEQDMDGVTGYWVNSPAPAEAGKVIIYLHGGGYILGSATTNLGSPIRVRRAADVPLLSVEYRLAPEHPFPAAVDDGLTVYRWLLDNGYTSADIAIYGDSAGGGLTLALTQAIREAGLDLPAAIAVLSPLADISNAGDTRITLADVDPVLRMNPVASLSMYAGETDPAHPQLSPVNADYTGFPPLLIQVGTREILLSDAVRVASSARSAGVAVTLDIREGMWHGWHDSPGLPEADASCADLAAFMVSHLQP